MLDTGVLLTTMTAAAAQAVSHTRVHFTNTLKTVCGGSLQVYRDAFDLQFANLALDRQKQMIELDPSKLYENMGLEVAGQLGFNILQDLSMQMDYRDGLGRFTTQALGPARMDMATNVGGSASTNIPEESEACTRSECR